MGLRTLPGLAEVPTTKLKGVGPQKAAALASMGIETVLDLLTHYPLRWVDRTHSADIGASEEGAEGLFVGRVTSTSTRRPRRGRAIVEVVVDDGTGSILCTFFNQPWRAGQLRSGAEVAVFGTVSLFRGRRQLANPAIDVVGSEGEQRTGKVVPIYPQSGKAGIGSAELARYLVEVLERAGELADPLPDRFLEELGLTDRTTAFRDVHAPPVYEAQFPARRRLKFDELFRLQLQLVLRQRAAARAARGIAHAVAPDDGPAAGLVQAFLAGLPFAPTVAQRRAIDEIGADMASLTPMHRLLQGDVGAGKTVVALATLLYAVQGGYQGALMVPTEVLAEQHFLAAQRLLSALDVPAPGRLAGRRPLIAGLLTARTAAGERARLCDELVRGEVDVLVGTHALLTEDVRFRALGALVIDEQHRFGVEQRAALREKAAAAGDEPRDPDVLVMTATPIPRTAAMTVYGDLDLTVLDELPPGRAPIRTTWCRTPEQQARAWERVRSEVDACKQVYVVCPLVSGDGASDEPEGENGTAAADAATAWEALRTGAGAEGDAGARAERRKGRSAEEEVERLGAPDGELAGLRLGLLHGQLPAKRKEEVMAAFRAGELDVLVATTVIEVGVDVAKATVMVVEDADRFGIAQLHQLRGRVGRASDPSWCFLLSEEPTPDAEERLKALQRTTDGFELAEVDLELRGEGTVLGTRQQGRNGLKLASLRHDRDLVGEARRVATAIVDEDPDLGGHPLLRDELDLFFDEESAAFLFKS